MANSVVQRLADELESADTIVDTTTATGTRAGTDTVNWVDGEPDFSSYDLLVVFDESLTQPNPAKEAQQLKLELRDAIPTDIESLAIIEPMGHGVFESGPHEGRPIVAVQVD